MKKPTLLYIPLTLLFLLTAIVFIQHSSRVFGSLKRLVNQSESVRVPFEFEKGKIKMALPEAAEAGIQPGDALIAVNGWQGIDDSIWTEVLGKVRVGEKVNYTIERQTENGETITRDFAVTGQPLQMTFMQIISDFSITVIFLLLLPALSFLLGFYVAFVRPRDPLAWVLLMLLLSVGSIAMEGRSSGTLIYFFQQTVINLWGIWMLLFGIYFPERWSFDKKYPWAKWILLVPLTVGGILNLPEQIGRLFNWRAFWTSIDNFTSPYDGVLTAFAMTATGFFFAILAIKSGTLENKDSRRRLRILYIGTSVSMLPCLSIVILRLVRGVEGGFFDLVPAWYAIFALLILLLFPLTMAYVIVVHRAMDVSVVVRQGLQYALAKNGVLVLQILLSIAVVFTAFSFVSDNETNRPQKLIFISLGVTGVFLIRLLAEKIKAWTDRKFFREAYNSEQILADLSENVRTMVETKPLLETVSNKISESLHVPQVALLLKNGNIFQPAYALGFQSAPNVFLTENDKTIEKLKTNEPLVIYQDEKDSWINQEAPDDERANLRQLNSQLLLPFGAKNELSGVISLSPKLSESPYTPTDLRLLKSVAAQTGLALENSRLTEAIVTEAAQRERMNREVEIAREVQERLFPQDLPCIEGLDYYGACRPALAVGGDYYDFLELPDGKFGIAIGDISGKGIGAALMMASLQASLRGQAIHFKDDLAGLMKQINSLVYEASTSNRYATFFYAQYELQTRKLSYVNAGHNPPFLLRRNAENKTSDFEVFRLEEGGAVVGMLPSMLVNYKQGEIELQSGDLLVGYTDGISEAMNPQEEEWSENEMLEELKKVYEKPAAEILTHVVVCADRFASGAKQHDDMTMIVVRVI
ncbi:MAG: SpoIIE family protein phosphatase [Acidobacteriota bacterium]|nr:SpoIIE family protein phosphatase [Acidobacteriota bacterium]